MKNYKDTLNLPNTDFPMKANLSQREPEILNNWKDNNLYQIAGAEDTKSIQQEKQ